MNSSPQNNPRLSGLAILAAISGVACLVTTLIVWVNVSAVQPTWPFPALYFLEITFLGLACAFTVIRNASTFYTWISAGIFCAFSILAAWTVGIIFFPFAIIFAMISIVIDLRDRNVRSIPVHLAAFLFGAVVQTVFVIASARLTY